MKLSAWSGVGIACALLTLPVSAVASTCRSNIDGDHIGAANAFRVSGVSCEFAVYSATAWTDSAAANRASLSPHIAFRVDEYEFSYAWRCQTHPLQTATRSGTAFACVGHSLNPRFGPARMSFRWWLPALRSCAEGVQTTRNQSCAAANRWIDVAEGALTRHGANPYTYYGYEPDDASPLFKCEARESESGESLEWEYWRSGRPPLSQEYDWVDGASTPRSMVQT